MLLLLSIGWVIASLAQDPTSLASDADDVTVMLAVKSFTVGTPPSSAVHNSTTGHLTASDSSVNADAEQQQLRNAAANEVADMVSEDSREIDKLLQATSKQEQQAPSDHRAVFELQNLEQALSELNQKPTSPAWEAWDETPGSRPVATQIAQSTGIKVSTFRLQATLVTGALVLAIIVACCCAAFVVHKTVVVREKPEVVPHGLLETWTRIKHSDKKLARRLTKLFVKLDEMNQSDDSPEGYITLEDFSQALQNQDIADELEKLGLYQAESTSLFEDLAKNKDSSYPGFVNIEDFVNACVKHRQDYLGSHY